MIVAKFLYALTITLIAAVAVMGVSVYRLQLPTALALMHLVTIGSICVGLCGVSIGIGARLPVFSERNPARIAGGFGGTVSLLLSLALVVLSLVGVGYISVRVGMGDVMTPMMTAGMAGIVLVNGLCALAAMVVGIRHFSRIEV